MKIALFGATGGTGRHIVDQALTAGHSIQALVRDPACLSVSHEEFSPISGDVLNPAAVAETVAGADAVISALGVSNGSPADVCSRGTRHVIETMKADGIRRLVVITSLGVGDSKDQVPFAFKMLMGTVLKKVMADKQTQEALVRGSGLDWTIVRPGGLADSPATGDYKAGLDKNIVAGQVSRADVAAFVLRQLADDTYLYETPAIT